MSSDSKTIQQPPIIKEEQADYLNARYSASFVEDEQDLHHIRLSHVLTSGNLVSQLVNEGKAAYGCEVISPTTFYRELYINPREKGSEQELRLSTDEVHLRETMLRPIIVSTQQRAMIKVRREQGLHECFNGRTFDVKQGTILADGGYWDVIASDGRLFSINMDDELASGTYYLGVSYKQSFHFEIYLAPDLHKNFHSLHPETSKIFLTGILASALEYIGRLCQQKKDFLEEEREVKLFLEDLTESRDSKKVLERIGDGEAVKIASTYRNIKMIADDGS